MFVISMAKLFAKKKRYKIDPTQVCNITCNGLDDLTFFQLYKTNLDQYVENSKEKSLLKRVK